MNLYFADNIHLLLLEKGLLTPDDITLGDYEVTSINRRNKNLQVTTLNEKNYLIKQVLDKKSENAKTLSVELSFYQYIKDYFPEIQSSFPKVNYADKENIILIIEFYKEAIPLWKYYREKGIEKMPLKTISAAGKLLGEMHEAFKDFENHSLSFLTEEVPFAFSLHKPHPKILSYMRMGGYLFIENLQQDNQLTAILDQVTEEWQVNSLIHGDIKLDNLIVLPEENEEESVHLKLIDWEMAQYGDRAWDVAGALQDFLFWWVIMMPGHETPEEMIQNATFPFIKLQPSIQAYWQSYCEVFSSESEANEVMLDRAVLFSGLRCIQTSYEISTKFEVIPPIAMILLNIGKSIIKDPQMAKEKLFALSTETAII